MELTQAKRLSDRIVSIELEYLAARETRTEFFKDMRTEMKGKHYTPGEIRAVFKAAKLEIEPLEKAAARKEENELAEAIKDTKRPNADGKILVHRMESPDGP